MEELIRKLMYPRFEVIAAYPLSPYKVGDIIDKSNAQEMLADGSEEPEYFRTYPTVFRELEWWENRTNEELMSVRFIQVTPSSTGYYVTGDKLKVDMFEFENPDTVNLRVSHYIVGNRQGGRKYSIKNILPATKAELIKAKES